ncbi:hypothetical protein EBZ39_04605 [bacterium]|nr:hypothetical protein [bacterium]
MCAKPPKSDQPTNAPVTVTASPIWRDCAAISPIAAPATVQITIKISRIIGYGMVSLPAVPEHDASFRKHVFAGHKEYARILPKI